MIFRSGTSPYTANRCDLVGIQNQGERTLIGVQNQIPGVGMHVHMVRMRQQMPLTTRQRDFNRELDWPAQDSIQ
jgi:hypothetical protein